MADFVREKKGRIWRLNDWGLRRLAYKIKKTTHANYILMNFEINAKHINDFKSMLDKDERIIRHLVMKRDEAITEDCPPPQEFDSLRAQEGTVDGDGNDGDELDLDGYDDGDGEKIVVIDDDYDDEDDRGTRSGRTSEAEKMAM